MRLALNHDIAFMAHVIGECAESNDRKHPQHRESLDPAFYHYNCLVLPEKDESIGVPVTFKLAAAVNILLSELTVRDKIADSQGKKLSPWLWLNKRINPAGLMARKSLCQWKFPLDHLDRLAALQQEREKESIQHLLLNPGKTLEFYAHPTASITGIIFQRASIVTGNTKKKGLMYGLGYRFGQLMYILDALEDFNRDQKKDHFNAIAAAYRYSPGRDVTITSKDRREVIDKLKDSGIEIQSILSAMPLDDARKKSLSHQFHANLNRRLRIKGLKDSFADSCETGTKKYCCHKSNQRQNKWFPAYSFAHPVRNGGRNSFLRAGLFFLSLPFMWGLRQLSFAGTEDNNPAPPVIRDNKARGCCAGLVCCGCCNQQQQNRRTRDQCCDCCDCGCECCDCCVGDGCDCCDCDCCDCDC
jgi:hypothetical protein